MKFCTCSLLTNAYKRVFETFFILFRSWLTCQNKKYLLSTYSQKPGLNKITPDLNKISFDYISVALSSAYIKNRLYKSLDYRSIDMLNFDFLEKGLGIVSPAHFVYNFSRKMFFMSCSINWPNLIIWLTLLLEILGNTCITIVC